ncbi:cortactin-binding protein 2 [Cottoperca gobio]|uniref:Cortactin-binding protein 2 n=1 Tax=Cottoperca gobio TaxID=56716 RepID=A0A6J2PVD7_COTGO|nr:cortactin-binding protein 2 [Cottoperca gobio]
MSAGCALTPADRYSTKMASEGASGEQPPPVQTLATAVLGSVDTKCEFNMDNLSKPELLTLLSIMEGELEARDLVIEALRVDCVFSCLPGDTEWLPDQELPLSPWDLVRKPLSQRITIRLKGLSESCLDESALECLFPLPLLHNYVRLVEQYGNLIFHGLEGGCQEYIANLVARCIKSKQEMGGLGCDVVRVEVEESLTKEQLLETFITCGFLVPAVGSGVGGSGGAAAHCVVVLLVGLEKASSLTGLLGDLCHSLDNRGSAAPLLLNTGLHHFCEGSFLVATLSKPRLQGSELRLQQHFRWVTLRWDQEPLHGLLGRHLRRKLLHKTGAGLWSPDGVMERSVLWVSSVWQQLNACLSRLGTHEALLGPQLFLSCPVLPNNTQAVVRWLARLWNAVVVPRVEEAIISRVTAKRSSSSSSSSSSPLSLQQLSPSNCGLSAGQQAVVKAALSILVNKAVLQGCPLPRHEIDRYLLEFRGGTFPLSAIGSYKGSGGGGGRKGRDSGKLRRSNTSPRKKGSPASSWSSGGSFREGSLSSTDVSFISKVQREPVGLTVFSDDETDLIRELQTMCSSKSEPDISKILQAKDDLILFSSSPSEAAPPHKAEQETAVQQRTQTTVVRQSSLSSSQAAVQSSDRRSGPRGKSQLPVPSSRGQQTRASSSSSSSSSSSPPSRTQMPPSRSRTPNNSSRTKQAPPSSNNNYYRNNINENNQSHEDIWILHRDLHENNNNK